MSGRLIFGDMPILWRWEQALFAALILSAAAAAVRL